MQVRAESVVIGMQAMKCRQCCRVLWYSPCYVALGAEPVAACQLSVSSVQTTGNTIRCRGLRALNAAMTVARRTLSTLHCCCVQVHAGSLGLCASKVGAVT